MLRKPACLSAVYRTTFLIVQPIFVVSIPCIAIKYRLGQLQKQELGGLFLKVKEKLPFCL
ncbi:MAG: hypothetical protein ACI8VJ_001270, partial [Polaribacter sp.]